MSKKKCSKLDAIFEVGSENEFRQQVWDLSILPYRYIAVLKISRKSGADSRSPPLVGWPNSS